MIVETDGFGTHSTRRAFEDDRARDVELEVSDWKVLRFTWRQLTRRSDWVVLKLTEALGVNRTPAPRPRSSPQPP